MKQLFPYVTLFFLGVSSLLWAESPTKPAVPESPTPSPAASALPTPLPAEQFIGRTREAYQAAAEIPDVLAGLHCYCGCDKSLGHRSLLDCFVDDHGAG
jgi:hypothetical protein